MEYRCENTLPDATKECRTTGMTGSAHSELTKHALNGSGNVLPDGTVSVNKVLSDEMENNDTDNTGEQRLTMSSTTSTDSYPDTTATAATLCEATDVTSNNLSAETPSNKDVGTKLKNNTMNIPMDENFEEVPHGAKTAVLPDKTARPLTLLPEVNLHITQPMPENITSSIHESKESDQADLDMKEPIKPLDTEWQEETNHRPGRKYRNKHNSRNCNW